VIVQRCCALCQKAFESERKRGGQRIYCLVCEPPGWQVVKVPHQTRTKLLGVAGDYRRLDNGMVCVMAWGGSSGTNTTAAGYGNSHQKLRRQLLPQAYGKPCSRCGLPMLPGQALHLDHDDHDRSKYRGFSHAACNLKAAARKGRAQQLKRRLVVVTAPSKPVHRW
jgi:hypothetical protein